MGDSISRASECIGFLAKRTALKKSWYKTNYGSETVISPAVGRKYIARINLRHFATTADLEYIFSLQPVI